MALRVVVAVSDTWCDVELRQEERIVMNQKLPRTLCLNCGDEPARSGYRYCSNICQQEFQLKCWIDRWLDGKEPNAGARRVKSALIYLHGEQCEWCGWHVRHFVTNNVPIELEHVDGNYKNNKYENVLLLCPNCHSLTDTFRALNRGNGREYRRLGRVSSMVEPLICNQQDTGSVPVPGSMICGKPPEGWWCSRTPGHKGPCAARVENTEAFDPYCHCQDPSCPNPHDYVHMTDIASDIDPEIMNHRPGRCIK